MKLNTPQIVLPESSTLPDGYHWGARNHDGDYYLLRDADEVAIFVKERIDLNEVAGEDDVEDPNSDMTLAEIAERIRLKFQEIDDTTGPWAVGDEVEGGDTVDTYDNGKVLDLGIATILIGWSNGDKTTIQWFDGSDLLREVGTFIPNAR